MRRIKMLAGVVALVSIAAIAADELSVTSGWIYNKNGRRRQLAGTTAQFDVSGNFVAEGVQTVATNPIVTAVDIGSVTSAGFAYFKNLNTNGNDFVDIGRYNALTNFVPVMRLYGTQTAQCFLFYTGVLARASSTNAVTLDYTIVNR